MYCRVGQLILIATLTGLLAGPSAAKPKTFYAIAHMTNSIETVDWAVGEGANGIEADLRFDLVTQQPTVFQHSIGEQPCDCSCIKGIASKSSVCSHLDSPWSGGGLIGCKTSVHADSLLEHAATKKELALVVIDSKVDLGNFPQDEAKLEAAGKAVVSLLVDHLFKKGYKGDVVISAPHLKQYKYIESAAKAAQNNEYKDRFYFTIDGEGGQALDVLDALVTIPSKNLPSKNRVYGTGISACGPGTYYKAILTGAVNQHAGVVGLVYIWTLDKKESMDDYIKSGATGVMTNYPSLAVQAAKDNGLALAQPGIDRIPAATSNIVVRTNPHCDCDYYGPPGGCKISQAAPAGLACHCTYIPLWKCEGRVVTCQNESDPRCIAPDKSLESCEQGGGDCEGYKGTK
jgi:glycerophosphoryl diester phosphodiesterase